MEVDAFTPAQIKAIAKAVAGVPRILTGTIDEADNVTFEAGVVLDDLEQALVKMLTTANTQVVGIWEIDVVDFSAEEFLNACNEGSKSCQ